MKNLFFLAFFIISCFSGFSQTFQVDTIYYNGGIEKYINVVILGDGYQQSEMDTFKNNAITFSNNWFQQTPFLEYKNFFNIFTINVPSNVSGAATDPDDLIDNYFGSSFNIGGIQRLMMPTKESKVITVLANNFPAYDQVVMLVNSPIYGGSGGWVATASTHSSSSEVAIHEIGHSFSNLGDEYWAGFQYATEKANRTEESNPELIKWKDWLNYNEVGIYEYEPPGKGWYRPHQACKMRYLFNPFCSVCTEQIFETIYNFSSPLNGFSPLDTNFIFTNPEETFFLDLIKPNPNTLKIEWVLNGDSIVKNTDTLRVSRSSLIQGINNLVVTVRDTSALSRKKTKGTLKQKTVRWTIENLSTGIVENINWNDLFNVYPNPSSGKITIDFHSEISVNNVIEIFTIEGKLLRRINVVNQLPGNNSVSIDLSLAQENILFIKLISESKTETKRLILLN